MNRKIIFLTIILITIIFIVSFLVAFFQSSPNTPSQTINTTNQQITTPTTSRISPLQKTIIGTTTEEEVENSISILEKTPLPNGGTSYSFSSPLTSRSNEIRTKDGVVIFERELTPVDPQDPGYTTITSFKNIYGDPEEIRKGSLYYGSYLEYLIYSSRGFTLIANPNTDEVFEIHFFEPMTTEEYINLYGDDIDPNPQNPEESHG